MGRLVGSSGVWLNVGRFVICLVYRRYNDVLYIGVNQVKIFTDMQGWGWKFIWTALFWKKSGKHVGGGHHENAGVE